MKRRLGEQWRAIADALWERGEREAAGQAHDEARKAEAARNDAGRMVDIVFDGPPTMPAPSFVEVENMQGESIRVGEWVQRPDGYWALRLRVLS